MDAATLHLASAGCATLASAMGAAAYVRARRAAPRDVAEPDEHPRAGWRRALAPFAVHLRPTSAEELELLETQLLTAGRRSREAIDRFCEERLAAMIGGMAMSLVFSALIGGFFGALLALVSL